MYWPLLAAENGLLLAGARGAEGSLATDRDALGFIASLGADSAAMLAKRKMHRKKSDS